ncbi:unannotated protein [freshwater metagenome]|jgi:hypothetical protein|uniref:Unannotated protein n=1 Tax=freshwater metagenome TaxID=449393 RepID=A0A6J6F5Z4_9ZZZZ
MPLVEWTVSNNAVQLSPPTGKAVDLVGSAAVVWAVLEEPRTLAAVTREAFDLDPALDEYQVRTILESLVAQRVVARDAADGAGDVAV